MDTLQAQALPPGLEVLAKTPKRTHRAIRLARALTKVYSLQDLGLAQVLRPMDLTRTQMAVLAHTTEEGQTMGELAANLWCDMSNLTGVVDRLVKAGFVQRARLPEDRRTVLVKLTEAGQTKQAEVAEVVPDYHARAASGLTAAEQAQLTELLEKYLRGAEAMVDGRIAR